MCDSIPHYLSRTPNEETLALWSSDIRAPSPSDKIGILRKLSKRVDIPVFLYNFCVFFNQNLLRICRVYKLCFYSNKILAPTLDYVYVGPITG